MLTGTMWSSPLTTSNCYILAEEDRCIVVDPNDSTKTVQLLEDNGWVPELIILTHEHCDHIEGLEAVRKRFPSAQTISSLECSAGMQDTTLNMSRRMEMYLALLGRTSVVYPAFTCREADWTYHESLELYWRGHNLRLKALPGHTRGSAGIWFDEKFFFSGDYFLPGLDPVLRLPGGDEVAYRTYTRPQLEKLEDGILICPGHGEPYRYVRK